SVLARKLSGINWAFVPYVRPGAPLAEAVTRASRSSPDVLILGNHGLVVGADTAEAANKLMHEVDHRLATPATQTHAPNTGLLEAATQGTDWVIPLFPEIHQLAFAPSQQSV